MIFTTNRIIEFKGKNEIIRMNRNYSNVNKRIWTDKYVREHHAKITFVSI